MQLGLASYSVRTFGRSEVIRFLKQLDLRSLSVKNVKDHLPSEPVEQEDALADYSAAGIMLHGAGGFAFSGKDEPGMRAVFEYCRRAGISMLVASDPAVDLLPRLERMAVEFDICIAIHNHGPEDRLWRRARAFYRLAGGKRMRSPLEVLDVVRNMDPRMGCCIDVGHTARAGVDVVEAIRESGPRLFNVHLKDLANFGVRECQVAVGDGIMPVRGIFEALEEITYKGFVDLEYEIHPESPWEGITRSIDSMRATLAAMGR